MFLLGGARYIDFRVSDLNGNPVSNRTLAQFQVTLRRNNVPCSDPLTLRNWGLGAYTLTYTPSAAGHDYLELYDSASDQRIIDTEDIVAQAGFTGGDTTVRIDQDYGGPDALLVTDPPADGRVYLFFSSDWDNGDREPGRAAGSANYDSNGRWTSPITAVPGTCHVALLAFRVSRLIKKYLPVS